MNYTIALLQLEWCKMKYLPKTKQQAENKLAYFRVAPFIYGFFFINLQLPLQNLTREKTKTAMQQMFHSMHVMACILMGEGDPEAVEIDENVKIFL